MLVTHMPPACILDLAGVDDSSDKRCDDCGEKHPYRRHWGDAELRRAVLRRVRPQVCLFGHVHEDGGEVAAFKHKKGGYVTFANR